MCARGFHRFRPTYAIPLQITLCRIGQHWPWKSGTWKLNFTSCRTSFVFCVRLCVPVRSTSFYLQRSRNVSVSFSFPIDPVANITSYRSDSSATKIASKFEIFKYRIRQERALISSWLTRLIRLAGWFLPPAPRKKPLLHCEIPKTKHNKQRFVALPTYPNRWTPVT